MKLLQTMYNPFIGGLTDTLSFKGGQNLSLPDTEKKKHLQSSH